MKNILRILYFLSLLITLGCVELDREITFEVTEKQVLESYERTRSRLASVYSEMPAGYLQIDGAMAASASDEAEHTIETSNVQKLNNGSWNAVDRPEDLWGPLFRGIRKANQFLAGVDSVNLDQWRLDPTQQTVYATRVADLKRWKYEARFLRAYFYFELVKRYGGVPIFKGTFSLNDDFKSVKRNTLQECFDFILSECDSAAKNLPLVYTVPTVGNAELSRITKGAALALKSRAWLYAASDMFNDPSWAGSVSEELKACIALPQTTITQAVRWDSAARAAKRLLDLPGTGYVRHNNYTNLFITNSFTFTENILARRNTPSLLFEQVNYPIGYDQGRSGTTPSQNMVDAYEMADGSKFDWNNPAHAANPYQSRDPRLALSIIVNNSQFKGRAVEAWEGGRDGRGVLNATRTGYYLKKYVNENQNLLQGATSPKSWNLFRLAEIHLNYAEALNEIDPGNANILTSVNFGRQRPGVGMPPIPAGLSQSEMRERIRNERRIELAFEDHRRWDVRRWLEGEQYLGGALRGVQIVRDPNDFTFTYTPIVVENRVFQSRMYLYPIPQGEILISPSLLQNPGW